MRIQKRIQPRRPLRLIRVPDPMYEENVRVAIGPQDAFTSWAEQRYDISEQSDPYSRGRAMTYFRKKPPFWRERIIWLHTFSGTPDDVAILVHEVFHIVCHIFEDRGVKFDFNNTEPWTYYLQRLMHNALTELQRIRKKRGKP